MKILTIVGARPQFVKAATLSREIQNCPGVDEVLVHTGQHFDSNMSEIFFEEMEIPSPDYNLEVSGGSHGEMTGRMLIEIEKVLFIEKPDWVVVYGDTNSTLAGALAAAKLNINVAHIEAGLRSFNMSMPEEKNRILTDRISTILFCPTSVAENNLVAEGYEKFNISIFKVGDVMLDAAMYYSSRVQNVKSVSGFSLECEYVVATCHRAENTDDPKRMSEIVDALNELSKSVKVVLPLHPRTKEKLKEYGLEAAFDIIEPVGYFDMLSLIINSKCILTDSGGLQKEAYFFKKPCVTMRDETEWVELVSSGVNIIAGANCESIVNAYREVSNVNIFPEGLYGKGIAAKEILSTLISNTQK